MFSFYYFLLILSIFLRGVKYSLQLSHYWYVVRHFYFSSAGQPTQDHILQLEVTARQLGDLTVFFFVIFVLLKETIQNFMQCKEQI